MVVSGLPEHNGSRHVFEIAELSMDFMATLAVLEMPIHSLRDQTLSLRVGINSGILYYLFNRVLFMTYCWERCFGRIHILDIPL